MTLRGGGGSEGLGCDANILLKHTLTLEDDVDVWLAKLVQGGYIPSAFYPTTHIPISEADFYCMPIFVCHEISNG